MKGALFELLCRDTFRQTFGEWELPPPEGRWINMGKGLRVRKQILGERESFEARIVRYLRDLGWWQ